MKQVIFYTKPDCPLCDKARAILDSINDIMPFDWDSLDISENPVLFDQYCFDIPVLEIDGQIIFRGHVDRKILLELLSD